MYDNIFFMKVGPHAGMSLPEIVAEKTEFQKEHGYILWGHGQTLFGGTAISPHINDNTFLLMHESANAKDTTTHPFFLNICECSRGKFRLPEGAIRGSENSAEALVCINFESASETIYLSEYYIPHGCGIPKDGDNYEYCEVLNYLQNFSQRSGVFGKHKNLFSASEVEKFKNDKKINVFKQGENSANYVEDLGRVDLRAQIIEAVKCSYLDENEAKNLPPYQPPLIK